MGYPPEYFTIQGINITAYRTEDNMFAYVDTVVVNPVLEAALSKHIDKNPRTDDKATFKKILEAAVNEYKSSQTSS